jgi:hypothetical protein
MFKRIRNRARWSVFKRGNGTGIIGNFNFFEGNLKQGRAAQQLLFLQPAGVLRSRGDHWLLDAIDLSPPWHHTLPALRSYKNRIPQLLVLSHLCI